MCEVINFKSEFSVKDMRKHRVHTSGAVGKSENSSSHNGFDMPYAQDEGGHNPVAAEQSMWRAVIVQALMDAASLSKKAEMQQYKREALVWLRGNSLDFMATCYHAGFEPEFTRELIKKALDNGCNWRATPGTGKRSEKQRARGIVPERKPTNSR